MVPRPQKKARIYQSNNTDRHIAYWARQQALETMENAAFAKELLGIMLRALTSAEPPCPKPYD